ncbi:23S rRNA (guanosine(2251)-2'-O)-methyltransferase RlmB [Blastococcus sp. VKM Ac-2987]|uniref:23S rRNA (guanosine(2251)-2'-O)-methyltransferase RlmB n=1 Tax=Blastococcus sp. VKM Ac-2987 TaxID=3004141 RepID=UPI0022AB69F1|nr:23S rRNA (guanosine(2251)-2'-O)-methyltransferase RlmB [Blastococcus sp. VKM Ac-2987]MCZ2858270.1 23S rRNA (guanosine(2251)-2'-O)-methyltransferase RlmB [Blastococcus sp. VKM Ac-2987]
MGADPLMAGNSQRRGRSDGAGKKRATAGTGGKNRRSLAGRGATPPAEARPGHPAQRRAAADAKARADRARARQRAEETPELLLGRNPVVEALRAQIPATALYVVTGDTTRGGTDERIAEALALAADRGLPLLEVGKGEFDRMSQGALHQGIGLQVPPYDYAHPEDLLDIARDSGRPPLVVALDGVTDPRNLGAVVRSAAAFGAHGVVVPQRRAVGMTASAWRTSAGAAARLRVARAVNLPRALAGYQDAGLQTVGLAGDGDVDLHDHDGFTDPVALVVGAEGTGLSRLVREKCDVVVRIPIDRDTESLNVSVAAGIALYQTALLRSANAAG